MRYTDSIDSVTWRQHAWLNRAQSLLLLAAMASFLGLLGWLLWGGQGIAILLATGATAVFLNPALSPGWVMRLYRATPLTPDQAPAVWRALAWLAQRAALPQPPTLYYVPSRMLNAFAVGTPQSAAIAVTDGMLRQLSFRELAGVLAHEVSHIRNNDLWVMGLADVFSRATSLLSLFGQLLLLVNLPLLVFSDTAVPWGAIALLVFAPTLSALAQLALSRTREFNADLNAARLTHDPEGLASALAKIESVQGGWMERILMPGRRIPEPSLLRTHPDTETRVARLLELKPKLRSEPFSLRDEMSEFAQERLGVPILRRPRWHRSGLWY